METQAYTIEHASAMPASTWHFLKMNDTVVDIPAGLAISPDVISRIPREARGEADAFENALAIAQRKWEREHPAPTPEELALRDEFLAAEADATYGGTALSAYQANADALEEARSLSVAFEHGMGEEIAAFLRFAAGDRIVVAMEPGKNADAQVVVTAAPDAVSAAAIDVVAADRSDVNLSIVIRGGQAGEATSPAQTGTTVRVFAGEGSRVSITRTQALGQGCADIDDMALFAADDARIEVRQVVLGADKSFTGMAGDLRGERSRIDVDTRYLGHGEQELDFNYALRHHGPKTQCALQANGVLAGTSKKTLRGTIDLVRGCKGAEGMENESVLLVDEGVHNKTVPVILCNEDDVAGNHGASIGHIREEQLFYLASRGLSQDAAERMFVSAVLEQAAIDAPDDDSREAVLNLGEQLSPGFAGLFDD